MKIRLYQVIIFDMLINKYGHLKRSFSYRLTFNWDEDEDENHFFLNKNVIDLILRSEITVSIVMYEPRHEKTSFRHMRTTKARISLRIHAV